MHGRRLVTGLTVAFAVMTAAMLVVGLVANPVTLVLAAVFALVTGLLWYQASGRLASRVYRRVEQQAAASASGAGQADRRRRQRQEQQRGGFGAGPREDWTGPRRGRGGQRRRGREQSQRQRQRRPGRSRQAGLSARRAADILGVEPDADEPTVKSAYRDRIKEVHPDTEDGDEEAFRRVQAAYERLTD